MSVILIANNATIANGQFLGDQACYLKAAYLFVQNQPDVTKVIISMSPSNPLDFIWTKFIDDPKGDRSVPPCEVIYDAFDPGDNPVRWAAWDKWRRGRRIEGRPFDHYRELYLRIHGAMRQTVLCGYERGLNRKNIYEYLVYGQENMPDTCVGSDWYDDTLMYHPAHNPTRDVYISPHCKTQGNIVFTFQYWGDVIHRLVEAGVSVTVGYDNCCGPFCEDLDCRSNYQRHWGDHKQWMEQVCSHKIVACGNTGTGWLAAACGVPLITMEPHNSIMADHRYRECGLKNIIEVIDGYKLDDMNNDMRAVAEYCAVRIMEEVGVSKRMIRRSSISDAVRVGAPYSVNPPAKLRLMAEKFLSVVDVLGDIADIGAYRGGTSVILRRLAPDKHLHLIDTWEGTPHDDPLCHHRKGEWIASLEECQKVVGDGELTHHWKGVFPVYMECDEHNNDIGLEKLRYSFVYVDPDTYRTVADSIAFFWPRLSPGGMLFFDDYGWEPCAGVKKAVDEAFTKDQRVVVPELYTCMVVKK